MNSAKILVVDDNSEFREVVRFALEREGYRVLEADSGARALAIIDREQPDLVLLDMAMPVMSGAQLVEELRRRGEERPFGVIAVSGSITARNSPTKWFLSKPLEIGLLLGVVADFCGRQRTSPLWVREQHRDSIHAAATFHGAPVTSA